jgi:hypothetical protein
MTTPLAGYRVSCSRSVLWLFTSCTLRSSRRRSSLKERTRSGLPPTNFRSPTESCQRLNPCRTRVEVCSLRCAAESRIIHYWKTRNPPAIASPGVPFPHRDISNGSPHESRRSHSLLCSALRLSQPLDGFILPQPCSLVSCCSHVQGSALQGVSPTSSQGTSSEPLYPHAVDLTITAPKPPPATGWAHGGQEMQLENQPQTRTTEEHRQNRQRPRERRAQWRTKSAFSLPGVYRASPMHKGA